MDYQTLDTIADAYIPLLGVLSILIMLVTPSGSHQRVKVIVKRAMFLTLLLIIAYGFIFIDNSLHLWEKMGLDYSTHTAVSLALVVFLCVVIPKASALWIVSLFLYFALMLYQQYHTITDIVSTGMIIFSISLCVIKGYHYKAPAS